MSMNTSNFKSKKQEAAARRNLFLGSLKGTGTRINQLAEEVLELDYLSKRERYLVSLKLDEIAGELRAQLKSVHVRFREVAKHREVYGAYTPHGVKR